MKYQSTVKALAINLQIRHSLLAVCFKSIRHTLQFSTLILTTQIAFSTTALAAGGVVDALQMPAWLERKGILTPLKPGIILQTDDIVKSGKSARILIRLDEGSLIKLGENALFQFDKLNPAKEERGFFEAALHVIKGAFRFTTLATARNHARQVDVRIGSITAGIRDTDIWGSSRNKTDTLCLIEGNITAQRAGEPDFKMQTPLTYYKVPENKPAFAVSPVAEQQLLTWANETELQRGVGIISRDGLWAVNLISLTDASLAKPIKEKLAAAGFAAEIEKAFIKGKNWYRVRVSGFKSREGAHYFATSIKGQYGISSGWVVKF